MFRRPARLAIAIAPVAVAAVLALPTAADAATVDSFSPAYGPVGTTVTITGSGLTDVVSVAFGASAPVGVTHNGDTGLLATVPADATTGVLKLTDSSSATTTTASAFTVQRPTAASITRSTAAVVYPQQATIRAVLKSGGSAVRGQIARLQAARIGTTSWWGMLDSRATSSTGAVQWTFTPRSSLSYRVFFRSTPSHLGSVTSRLPVRVQPSVTIAVPGVARILTSVKLTGRVRPGPTSGSVYLQRWSAGAWRRVARMSRTSSDPTRFWTTVRLPATGRYSYRLVRPADGSHLPGVSGAHRVLGVNRTLSQGTSGSDVLALQQRLRTLHYDVGAVNGSFGFDTFHAVIAFEKVQSMTRDGVVGPAVWLRLTSPRLPRLLHPLASAAGVEVNLTHQVLYYAVDGYIRRIFDASTGGGYTYTGSDGQTHQAITPTGHFHIVYKRDGWVTAPLGTLYRPAYFNYQGYAIHGETEVPSYPASHGCVRITVPAMDRFNAQLPVGLSVWIYRT